MKKRITERTVESMKPPAKGCRYVFDSEPKGFGVRITAAGTRTFTLDYRNKYGENRRYNIGQWGEGEWSVARAVAEATKLRAKIVDGHDPVQEKKQEREEAEAELTVAALADRYYDEHVMKENREDQQRNVRDIVNKIVKPKWGDRRVSAVGESDVRRLHRSLKHEREHKGRVVDGRYRANRVLSTISAIFNFGIREKLCATNPAKGVKKFPEDKRTNWLDEAQLRNIDTAITEYGKESAELIRLLLLTGYRKREWMRAKKDDFDMAHGIWTKPSHSVKENKTEQCRLSGPAMEVLRRVMKTTPNSEFLFPGKIAGRPRTTIRKVWEQVLRKAGLVREYTVISKAGNPLKRYRPLVRLHDLRHSYCSWLAEHGVPLKKIGALVGHQRLETTDRYAHIADRSLLEASEMFGAAITKLVQ